MVLFSGITAPIVGTIMDKETVESYGLSSYAPVFYVYVALMIISAVITLLVPFDTNPQVDNIVSNIVMISV